MKELGIDVSQCDGKINWEKAKEAGIQFAILRIGHTNNSSSKRHYKDKIFEYNYEQCKNLGIKIGIYYQGAAISYDEGRKDAQQVLKWLTGKSSEIGIFVKLRSSSFNDNDIKVQITEGAKGFCSYLKNNNWISGVSANISFLKERINMDEMADYELWCVNHETVKPTVIREDYGLWQFDNNEITDLSNKIHMDYLYIDYLSIAKENELNGYIKDDLEEVQKEDVTDIIEDISKFQEVVYVPDTTTDKVEDVIEIEEPAETDAKEKEQIQEQNNSLDNQLIMFKTNGKILHKLKVFFYKFKKSVKSFKEGFINFFVLYDEADENANDADEEENNK